MERREISMLPAEWAKIDAYVAVMQECSPGIDASGVITYIVQHLPWAAGRPEALHGVYYGMWRFLRRLDEVQADTKPS